MKRIMAAPALSGIHHIKFAVADLDRSIAFYERVLVARRQTALEHRHRDGTLYAVILEVPGFGPWLEQRLNPQQAAKHAGFDPVTLAVRDRAALADWIAHLDTAGAEHSPVLVSLQA